MDYEEKVRRLEARVQEWRYRIRDADDRKTYDEVFDRATLLILQRLISSGAFSVLDYPVATGKEGNVFKATTAKDEDRAVKIYRVATATFASLSQYIIGDPRFPRIGGNRRKLIHVWALKEFKNLQRMAQAEVRVPIPHRVEGNVLVMDYIGDKERPAPLLRDVIPGDAGALFRMVLQDMKHIHESGLVHGDLSEFNILFWDGEPWVIDVAQAVPLGHPRAEEWFRRDMVNMARYFTRLGLETDPEKLTAEVRGG
jgi:RIO kinase 1